MRPTRHRRSVRLPGHGYAEGLYFVTVCTACRRPAFGAVRAGAMHLSATGRIADAEWRRTASVRASVRLDAHVVMPDHVHLLFAVVPSGRGGTDDRSGTDVRRGTPSVCPYPWVRRFGGAEAGTVATIMRQYKSVVTKRVWAELGRSVGPVWQRGYHDRVVRTPREAAAVRRYIAQNPARWNAGSAGSG